MAQLNEAAQLVSKTVINNAHPFVLMRLPMFSVTIGLLQAKYRVLASTYILKASLYLDLEWCLRVGYVTTPMQAAFQMNTQILVTKLSVGNLILEWTGTCTHS